MNPIHIVSNKEDIAKLVLLPGDPLRAKYIAENFLENVKLVNEVRNMLGFTGEYKGHKITVIGSGMGIPSVGIYSYELYHFYDVEKIIRIGTAGAYSPEVHVRDIVLGENAFSHSSFENGLIKAEEPLVSASKSLIDTIYDTSKNLDLNIFKGTIYTAEIFDVYINMDHLKESIPSDVKPVASEMEAFGLYHIAKYLNKDAACIVSISDSKFEKNADLTSEERQTTLNQMIELALESIIK